MPAVFEAPRDLVQLATLVGEYRRSARRVREAVMLNGAGAAELIARAHELAGTEHAESQAGPTLESARLLVDLLAQLDGALARIAREVRRAAQAVGESEAKLKTQVAQAGKFRV